MSKNLINFIINWSFLLMPLIYVSMRIGFHNGYKEGYVGYFIFAAFISLILVTFTTKSFISHISKSVLGIFLITLATELFWGYMDHPWFAGPETNTCDGACFGWFSFENDAPSMIIVLGGTIFMLLTGFIKTIVVFANNKLNRAVKRSHKVT